jgi:hypothetical protein
MKHLEKVDFTDLPVDNLVLRDYPTGNDNVVPGEIWRQGSKVLIAGGYIPDSEPPAFNTYILASTQQSGAPEELTIDDGVVTFNPQSLSPLNLTLEDDTALAAETDLEEYQSTGVFFLTVTQDEVGNHALTFTEDFEFPLGPPVISQTPSSNTVLILTKQSEVSKFQVLQVGGPNTSTEPSEPSAISGLILEHVASPPSTGAEETALFVDIADGKLYQRAESDGAVTEIGAGGSSGRSVVEKIILSNGL